jgi:hypothetical protein
VIATTAPSLDALICGLNARREGSEWKALCPVHNDKKASLGINVRGGTVVFRCYAGCSQQDVLAALRTRGLWPAAAVSDRSNRPHIVATYDYRDQAGTLLYQAVRYDPKDFKQRRPDGADGWTWKLDGVPRVLYRLPELLAADPTAIVYVAEGEKDVDQLRALGLVATTNVGGAGKWRSEYSDVLRGRQVVILPDNDAAGRDHARKVAAALTGKASAVAVVELPGLSDKGDVSDWLAGGGDEGGLGELARAAFSESVSSRIDSSYKSSARDETKPVPRTLTFAPISEAIAAAPPSPDWTWYGYGALGSVTGLVARPKDGKTTLVCGLLQAQGEGADFLGLATRSVRTVLLSEERESTLREKVQRWGLGDHVDVLLRHQARGVPWEEVVRQAVAHAQAVGAAQLVVDTFAAWAGLGGDTENSAGAMLQAAEPLLDAAANGLAVLVSVHRRKSGGEFGEGIRGSSALAGVLDVIIELERPKADIADAGATRILRAVSRYEDTPVEVVVRLTEEHGYEVCGDLPTARTADERTRVLDALDGSALTGEEVATKAGLPKGRAFKRLNELLGLGKVERRGEGKRASPYLWRIAAGSFVSSREQPYKDESIRDETDLQARDWPAHEPTAPVLNGVQHGQLDGAAVEVLEL